MVFVSVFSVKFTRVRPIFRGLAVSCDTLAAVSPGRAVAISVMGCRVGAWRLEFVGVLRKKELDFLVEGERVLGIDGRF